MISIIVPIYNGEKFIDECIQSLISQTYKDIEIIIVDDGSTDKTYSKCNEWKQRDHRIKLIKKENGGVSSARNLGLKHMNGQYISFVDIDDQIAINYYEMVLHIFDEYKCDIVVCNYMTVFPSLEMQVGIFNEIQNVRYHNEILKENGILGFVFNKVYSKDIVDKIYFDSNIKIYEDLLFNMEVAMNKPTFHYIDTPLYYYNQVETSAMHSAFEKDSTRFLANIKIIEILRDLGEETFLLDRMYYYIWDFRKYLLEERVPNNSYLAEKHSEYFRYILKNDRRMNVKIKILMMKYFYFLFKIKELLIN